MSGRTLSRPARTTAGRAEHDVHVGTEDGDRVQLSAPEPGRVVQLTEDSVGVYGE